MDAKTARAILAEAAAGGFFEQLLPADEEELINTGKYYLEEAALAKEAGMDNLHVNAIIALGSPAGSQPADSSDSEGVAPQEATFTRDYVVPEEVAETYPRRSSGGFSEQEIREAIASAEEMVRKQGLPIPSGVDITIPHDMPTDLTELGDKEIRRLHGIFNAYLARARWLLAIANSDLSNATQLRDAEYRRSYQEKQQYFASVGERVTKDLLDSFAKDDEEYQSWNTKVLKHSHDTGIWKTLVDIYSGNVDRLSREWTMRTEEYERSR